MKPLKLTLEGFNSYENQQEVDFEKLMEYGMFGIFGKTGSGKSSIIDGIIVALYGNVQNNKSRSGFINTNCDKAIVSFEFAVYKNSEKQVYRVHRIFEKNNGDGIKTKMATLRVINNGVLEPVAEGNAAVNKEIVNIIGLVYDDFTRAVVLPQGTFAEFLHIGGDKKRDMLERVFGLEKYGKKLVKKAREQLNEVAKEKDKIEDELESFNNMDIDEDAEAKLAEVKEQYKKCSENKVELNKKYDTNKNIYDEVKQYNENVKKLNKLEIKENEIKEKESVVDKYKKKLQIQPIVEDIEKTEKELEEKKEKLSQKEKDLQIESENCDLYKKEFDQQQVVHKENMEELAKKQETLDSITKNVKEIKGIEVEIKDIEFELKELKVSEKEKKIEINELQKNMVNIEKYIAEIKEKNTSLESEYTEEVQQLIKENKEIQRQLNESKEKIQNKKDDIAEKEKHIKQKELEIREKEIEKDQLQKSIETNNKLIIDNKPLFIDDIVELSQNVYGLKIDDVNTAYFNDRIEIIIEASKEIEKQQALFEHIKNINIAVELAKTLEDNQPCPVCGSKAHPNIAIAEGMQKELISNVEKEIEKQKELIKNTEKEMNNEIDNIKISNDKYIKNKNKWLEENRDNENKKFNVEGEISGVRGNIAQLSKDIEKFTNELVGIEKQFNERNSQIDSEVDYIKEYDEMEKSFKEIRENSGFLQNYLDKKETKGKEINNIKDKLRDVELNIVRLDTEKAAKVSREQNLNDEIQQKLKGKSVEQVQVVIDKRREKEENEFREKEEKYKKSQENIRNLESDIKIIKINNENGRKNIKARQLDLGKIIDDKKEIDTILKIDISENLYKDYNEEIKNYNLDMYEVKNCIEKYMYKDEDYDEEELRIQCNEMKNEIDELDKKSKEFLLKIGGLEVNVEDVKKNKEKIEKLKAKQKECLEKFRNYEKLVNTFDTNRGNEISFLDYVSHKHLRFIAEDASDRLRRITNNRYSIETKEDNEFVIIDYNKGGSRRAPKTLSGGETFLVSLCLALALSKQVQFKKSSVLEFFFLDEGFGTLDSELLTAVISTLGSLKDESLNIGIISHVEELKETMPRKLIVTETIEGSELEVM